MDEHASVKMGAVAPISAEPIPAFSGASLPADLRTAMAAAVTAWLLRTPSAETRRAYRGDLDQFFKRAGITAGAWEQLAAVRPEHVAHWRDALAEAGQTNSTIRRKLTTLRSLFSYLQTYGYAGANPAHGKFIKTPAVPRDGKTIGLSPHDCRRLLDAPDAAVPVGVRDRALLAVLAYSGCRVGELIKLRVRDYRATGEHRILSIVGKGGKERTTPLHLEAVERLAEWLAVPDVNDPPRPLFSAAKTPRGQGRDGFVSRPMAVRSVEKLIGRYASALQLDPNVTVHSLRVTALTTARERGSDIIDLQDFAGHADPRTTLTYIRSRDRLSKSPTYVLKY